ncbi:ABC transporter ATP-binding protein [Aminipila luticellarii]|uniref:ABC transporter ATP-binding protein n=1 Tax=Aminipila luticellarii TaxID=2507160 RepID=A0A410PXA0_9FIRM|nr:ABC transporter ATP-binding protein [Aminipila luticellarii]QAT43500.1 ABC transporter ATP-binding protein [Aminipila luticellarii]
MEKESCIVLKHMDKSFGKHQILKDINIEVPYGDIYGMLGPSGCGKTTTVKIIAGISEATSGEVLLLNKRMPDLELMRQVGYMAQSDALYGDLSARENLVFFGQLYGIKEAELKERIEEVMEVVNLSQSLDTSVLNFSGGMKRRVSLAMTILHRPKVLILDEPTVGIDPLLRKNIWNELYQMTEKGTTILVTTHVMDEAEKCTHLSMMREGMLLAKGTPAEIQEQAGAKNLEEAFLYFSGEREEGEEVRL